MNWPNSWRTFSVTWKTTCPTTKMRTTTASASQATRRVRASRLYEANGLSAPKEDKCNFRRKERSTRKLPQNISDSSDSQRQPQSRKPFTRTLEPD
mmetsp:Transcript_38961/g.154180  ORF Transcript_38961/g.154180 Transcript_38961/m.154180 type:complete len:96 (-) Transcript_38961:595-882(-)